MRMYITFEITYSSNKSNICKSIIKTVERYYLLKYLMYYVSMMKSVQ